MIHRVQAAIDLRALQHNFQIARQRAGSQRVVAVIKANAYGHGLEEVAGALTDADIYGVTEVHEALALKAAGTDKPILVLQGLMTEDDLNLVSEHTLQLVVHSADQLTLIDQHFSKSPPKQPITLWLKMDSGMGRLGISPHGYATTFTALKARPYVREVIMMTHLANASLPDSPLNLMQLQAFREVEKTLSGEHPVTSIPSSSGILADLDTACDIARPGIMLYGSSPFDWREENLRREQFGLKAVMTLQARIIAVKDLRAGDNIGYCSQFICPTDMRVGIVSMGYADGYPSNAPNNTPVMVGERRTTTVGRVSMDMLAIDLSAMPDVVAGDIATLWGNNLSLDEVAAATGILSYNLTCSINQRRVEFVYR